MAEQKIILALQNTIIHSRRPIFIIEEKNHLVVCDTPGSRNKLNVYIGKCFLDLTGEKLTVNQLKNYVYKNEETNETYKLKIEDIIDGYKLIVPVLTREVDRLEVISESELFELSLEALAITNIERKIIAVNKRFEYLFGYKRKDIKGKYIYDVFNLNEEEKAYAKYNVDETQYNEQAIMVGKRKTKNKESIKVQISHAPIYSQDIIIGHQIAYKELEGDKGINLSAYQKVIDHNTDGVMIADENQNIIYANNAFIEMLEYQMSELRQTTFFDQNIMNFPEPKLYREMRAKVDKEFKWQGESWERKRSGKIIPVWKQIFVIKDEEDKISRYVAIYKDLSNITSAKMVKLVDRDPLTSLYSREYFIKRVSERIKEKQDNHRVLFIDVDDFKGINDTYGHVIGDKLLIEFSKLMVMVFRGHLKARYAGDEFVVYFGANNEEKEILRLIEEFREMTEKPITLLGKQYMVRVSMGLSKSPDDGIRVAELLDVADHRMYYEKEASKERRKQK